MRIEPKLQTALWVQCFVLGLLSLNLCSRLANAELGDTEHYDRIGTRVAQVVSDHTLSRLGQPPRKEIYSMKECILIPNRVRRIEFRCTWKLRVVEVSDEEGE